MTLAKMRADLERRARTANNQSAEWIDTRLFPATIRYASHRLHILALMLLGAALLFVGDVPKIELLGGNYTNIVSALCGCIMLLQQLEHRRETAHLHRRLDDLHDKVDQLPASKVTAKRRSVHE